MATCSLVIGCQYCGQTYYPYFDTSTLMGLWKHLCVSTNCREKHDLLVLHSHYYRYSFRRCHISFLM